MSRNQAAPTPCHARSAPEYISLLRQLRAWAGLTYREIESRSRQEAHGLPRSTLGAVLARNALPREDFIDSFVRACGQDSTLWLRARRRLAVAAEGSGHGRAPAWLTAAPLASASAPHLLPPVQELVGRDDDLRHLAARVVPSSVTVVTGSAGVGKSTLVVRVAHEVASRFPDGQVYVDLRGAHPGAEPLTDLEVVRRLAEALGVPGCVQADDVRQAAVTLHAALAGRRVLIVLDNVAVASQIRSLIPANAGTALVLTSRASLSTIGFCWTHSVQPLPPPAAEAMLTRLLGAERVGAEPDALRAVAALCDHLPLALWIAAARLRARPHWPVRVIAERLGRAEQRLDELRVDHLDLRASLSVSLQTVAQDIDGAVAVQVLRLLGYLPETEVVPDTVAYRLSLSAHQAWEALERLVDASLISSVAPGRYRVPALVRLLGRELVGPQHEGVTPPPTIGIHGSSGAIAVLRR
ncbi:NB-ARC domain-containing protein [Micromonospora sp. DSM 115977]|uniref:NB-ARC domain-containing protein n=1 Tax=Micromonospora reichwaldensis TaxID=3075516 RepID=A0ABU2X2D2_9ACTN|nr:NB-ARC domain-containing protein [Micromonospora sp. DSM 115977]MDT0531999.1 NB-ARC domain-containing protein [Micromonospora sp. DSM 115977]